MKKQSSAETVLSVPYKQWVRTYKHILFDYLRSTSRDDLHPDDVDRLLNGVIIRKSSSGRLDVFIDSTLSPEEKKIVHIAIKNTPRLKGALYYLPVALVGQQGAAAKANTGAAHRMTTPPRLGERMILLILRTKEERANIPGDLEEEFKLIAATHGERYAKLWYYKQVVASAWPLIRKAVGWGLLASIGEWIRRGI